MRRWLGIGAATLGLGAGLLAANLAAADPRLDETVYDPYVESHVLEFEGRGAEEIGRPLGGQRTFVGEVEYGVSSHVSLAVVAAVARDPGRGGRLARLGVEGVISLGAVPRLGVDTALYLEYAKGLNGETDTGEAKLLLARTAGRFQGLANLIAERPFGAPRGQGYTSYGYAGSMTWRTLGKLRLGAEVFGDLGDDHGFLDRAHGAYAGPEVKWAFRPPSSPVEFALDAGWLAAIGADRREARTQVRLGVEMERRF